MLHLLYFLKFWQQSRHLPSGHCLASRYISKNQNHHTIISGGIKCKTKFICSQPSNKKKNKEQCDDLILKRDGKPIPRKKFPALTTIQGGALNCPTKSRKKPLIGNHAGRWKKFSLFGALPLVGLLTLIVFSSHMEMDRSEFKNYTHMYKRSKPFWFRDGNRSAFHNSHFNALPPAGYEDEIDESAVGKDPESDKEKKKRINEFQKVSKDWHRHVDKRDAQIKKEQATAKKEAKRQETREEK